MEQTIATKRRRNIGKSVTAKTRAWLLRPDVPRRQREDTIMIPAPFILPLSRSPSTQPLFFHFSQSLFPHFLWRTDGWTDAERAEKAKAEMAGGENRNYRPRGGRKQRPSKSAARRAWSRNRLKKVTQMIVQQMVLYSSEVFTFTPTMSM